MEFYKFNKDVLAYQKTNEVFKWKVISFVLFLAVGLLFFVAIKTPVKEYIETEVVLKEENKQKELFERIDELPFKYPEIVKAQALIETGNFKSAVYLYNNNVFGMKFARQRLTTANGDNLKHASYNTVEESLIDRLLYESKYMSELSKEGYYSFLDKLYAEGDNYSVKLKQIIKNNKL